MFQNIGQARHPSFKATAQMILFASSDRLQGRSNGAEALQASLNVVDDFLSQVRGLREIVEIGEAVILEPEEVEAGFIAGNELVVAILPPTAFRVLFGVPGFLGTPCADVDRGTSASNIRPAMSLGCDLPTETGSRDG